MRFMDMREWIARLDKEGELRRITAEVDWDRELGAIARRVLEKRGPALLFEAIAGYRTGRCTKLFTGGLGTRERLALALGFPKDVGNREIVGYVMQKNRERIAPAMVRTGPVKDVIVRGPDVDQAEFPVPRWLFREGGRYIHTFSAIVTRDPETRVMNAGIYRGMISRRDTTPFLLLKGGQHWGNHFLKYSERGEPMPVACVIGWDPIMPVLAGSPIPAGVCEWDVMGAYRGEPAELVRCETVDLDVPATAEIVIEGHIADDPSAWELEGPFGEFTGYVSDLPTRRPTMTISCITHRRDPIFRGCLEGTLPGSYSENSVMSSVQQIDWAIAHRLNAGEGGIVVFPGSFGSPIDPSTPMEDRDVAQLGSGLWNRVLFDATRNWKFPKRPEWDGERFPPTVRPAPEDEARVRQRWDEYGLGDL
jgi:4-hydroxy-3-polyprenylbenzoate decarboxylase